MTSFVFIQALSAIEKLLLMALLLSGIAGSKLNDKGCGCFYQFAKDHQSGILTLEKT